MPRIRKWYKLDNAAKIIPPTSRGSDTRVFRLMCELKEEICPEALQAALEQTIPDFPHFHCHMKKGLFWYYLEASHERPVVEEEHLPALSPLYVRGRKNVLYRLTYYQKRISLEMFHALSDGAGGFFFFKQVILQYLHNRYGFDFPKPEFATGSERGEDPFDRFYVRSRNKRILDNIRSARKKAYRLKGDRDENLNLHLIEGSVSVKALFIFCRSHNTTIAIASTAFMIEAIIPELRKREYNRPIVISVPINLRNYFPTTSARNFFGVINVVFPLANYDGSFESILQVVESSFKTQLTEENVRKTMNTFSALEHNWAIRMVPLTIKDIGIQGFNFLRTREVTTSVSNVGIVTMPEGAEQYVEKFASFMSTQRMQLCLSSFSDQLVFGFASAFKQCAVIRNFFRNLAKRGIAVELVTNDYDLPARVEK